MSDISEILSSVASNPDLLNKISSAVKGEGKDMSEALGEVISLISEAQGENSEGTPNESNESAVSSENEENAKEGEDKKAGLEGLGLDGLGLDGLFGGKGNGIERLIFSLGKSLYSSSALLIALKPYLKKSRQDFIEAIIKLSKLGSIASLVK